MQVLWCTLKASKKGIICGITSDWDAFRVFYMYKNKIVLKGFLKLSAFQFSLTVDFHTQWKPLFWAIARIKVHSKCCLLSKEYSHCKSRTTNARFAVWQSVCFDRVNSACVNTCHADRRSISACALEVLTVTWAEAIDGDRVVVMTASPDTVSFYIVVQHVVLGVASYADYPMAVFTTFTSMSFELHSH